MKRKLLATLLAASVAFSLCACGNQGESGVSQPDVNPPTSESTTNNAPENPTPDNQQTEDNPTTDEESTPDVTQDVSGGETIDTPAPEDSETGRPEGLILMTVSPLDVYRKAITITALNPDTGDSRTVSEFWFGRIAENGAVTEEYYTPEGDALTPGKGYYATRREWFNEDYSLMAVTRYDCSSGESCAGWLDANGNFFNVTDTLGMSAKSDFDTSARQTATGFSEDGYFSYMSLAGEGVNSYREYYHIPVDSPNRGSVQAGIALPGVGEDFVNHNSARFSDWDSQTNRFLCNTSGGVSRLCVDVADSGTSYIPGDSRLSWNGVFSPDGGSVAFMSKPKSGGDVNIYVMPLDGGEPVKINTGNLQLATQDECNKGYYANIDSPCVMLIGWQ